MREGYQLAHYLSTHDVPTLPYQLEGDWRRYRLAVALQMTSIGIPVIYYGEEVGRVGGDWPANRSDMPWGGLGVAPGSGLARDEALRADITRMVGARRGHPALSRGAYTPLSSDGDLLVFMRHDPDTNDAVVVAVNRAEAPVSVVVDLPPQLEGRPLVDMLGGTGVAVTSGRLALTLDALAVSMIAARELPDSEGM